MTDIRACRDCGKPASASAITCPSCGAIRPGVPAAVLSAELALGKAKQYQGLGAFLFFGSMVLMLMMGKDAMTIGLLGMGAGLVLVVAARIDMNAVKRRRKAAA